MILPDYVDAYFLGLWLGDGDSDTTRITSMDENVITYLEQYAKRIGLIAFKSKQKGKAFRISLVAEPEVKNTQSIKVVNKITNEVFYFNSLTQAVKELNLKSQGNASHALSGKYKFSEGFYFSKQEKIFCNPLRKWFQENNLLNNKHFPSFIFELDELDLKKLLAGYIDSDGTKESLLKVSITQKSKELINGIQNICNKLNLNTSIHEKITYLKYKNYEKYISYKIKIFGKNIEDIPILLERKKVNNNNK